MRNADLMAATVALSPIDTSGRLTEGTPAGSPNISNPLTPPFHGAAESVSGEQTRSSSHPRQEEQKNGGLTFTPVRRSLRLNNEPTTPLANLFPSAGRPFAGNEPAVVLLANPHLTNKH